MRTIVVTGAASGIGKATADRLQASGCKVIGVDLRDTDVIADLSTAVGRREMVQAVEAAAHDGVDGIVAAAGVCPPVSSEQVISVNYFGAVATLEGLYPLLRKSSAPRAVAVVSVAAIAECSNALVDACLSNDEEKARTLAAEVGETSYAASKHALALWLRKTAISRDWAGAGVCLNGVGPGTVQTPMTLPMLETEEGRAVLAQATPVAIDRYGEPEEIAEVLAFLVTMEGRYLLGQIVFVDGGTEALQRPGKY